MGSDIGVPKTGKQLTKIGHGDSLVSTDIDPPQQRHVPGHLALASTLLGLPGSLGAREPSAHLRASAQHNLPCTSPTVFAGFIARSLPTNEGAQPA
ncbi:MAG: hypothetical protein PVS3B2_18180 [Candidatus Dormibacteraceae bacterium]